MKQAIESQMGMLTCQVIDLQVQLQMAYNEIGRLNAENEKLKLALAPPEGASQS